MSISPRRNLSLSQRQVLKKYDQKYGDGHGHLMIKYFNGHRVYLN